VDAFACVSIVFSVSWMSIIEVLSASTAEVRSPTPSPPPHSRLLGRDGPTRSQLPV